MNKEIIISIILVILIIIADCITQNYTKKSIETLVTELENLKQSLSENSNEKINEQIEKINKKWEEVHDNLAYYIEHDELEKVETHFVALKSFVETNEHCLALNEVETMSFTLEHIEDKYEFNLVNIF